MPQYRVFELNPITNEWRDKGFHEGNGQQDVLRKSATEDNTYFCVPGTSYHPVTLAKVETVRYAWQYGEPTDENGEPEAIAQGDGQSAEG